jgi:hypothetical protein
VPDLPAAAARPAQRPGDDLDLIEEDVEYRSVCGEPAVHGYFSCSLGYVLHLLTRSESVVRVVIRPE